MSDEQILVLIKRSMRISSNDLDLDLLQNIQVCLEDMNRLGVNSEDPQSNLVIKAVELYCKWQYDYLGKGEQFRLHYDRLVMGMSQAKDYASENYWPAPASRRTL